MLMNRTLIMVAITAMVGCFAKQADRQTPTSSGNITQELTPPSELALMMREMAIHADSVKAAVGRGGALPPYPKAFRNMMKAEPTAGMHIDAITFPTFGKDYLTKLDRLHKVKKEDHQQAYNALVQSCANCHGSHCPGPLMRIKKMYIKTE